MKEPNLTQLKIKSGIPTNAKFIGWLIHNPLKDDFLSKYNENEFILHKQWCQYPELSIRFKKFKKAQRLRDDLDLEDKANVVAGFDCGPGIRIAA